MKIRIIWPMACLLATIACGPSPSELIDAATQNLIQGIDNASSSDIREAISQGARVDALAGMGKGALHYASETGDADLAAYVLNHLGQQKPAGNDLVQALSQTNKESHTALEIAARRGHTQVIDAFGAFCEGRNILRAVFFPTAKKLASEGVENLDLITGALSRFGVGKNHMAHLIFETIGTNEGQAILRAHNHDSFLFDFAQAYIIALDASPEIQEAFLKVASAFRIEKRTELIDLMSTASAKDLYRNIDKQINAVSAKLGVSGQSSETAGEKAKPRKGTTSPEADSQLRAAVLSNDLDALLNALENGARVDALDANSRNAFHIAAINGRFEAMTILLSQLQCSNADLVLLQKDKYQDTPFSIAASWPKERNQILRAISEFLISGKSCQEIAKTEIRDFVRVGADEKIIKSFAVFSEIPHGVEVISDIVYRLLGGDFAQKAIQWLEQSLCVEAKDHVWARIYFQALSEGSEVRVTASREHVKTLGDVERRQIVGFMLFLSSGQGNKIGRDSILGELDHLQLPHNLFENAADGVADIKAALDEIVTGQDNAKISLAVAIKNHYERVEKGLKKSNILILGPSGTGKTLLVQTIAQKLNVPFAVFDSTNITQAGYIGGKATDAVAALAEKGEFDKAKIERGIIFLDEIDKMAGRSGRSENDEFKRQGQASLLKMIEGLEVEVPLGRFDSIKIDTSNILFVCAGAFTGLPEIIDARLKAEGRSLGDHPFEQAMAEDLIKYGMAPEMLGRLPNVITLRHLSVDDMVHILKNPKASVLEEYRALFASRGVEIKFTDGAILAMAERAVTFNVGARALRTVAESVMSDLQFRIGNLGMVKTLTVTERVVRFGDMPTLEYKTE